MSNSQKHSLQMAFWQQLQLKVVLEMSVEALHTWIWALDPILHGSFELCQIGL